MAIVVLQTFSGALDAAVAEVYGGISSAIPRLITAVLVLLLAFVGITLVLRGARGILDRLYPGDEGLIADLAATVIGGLLWFTVVLALLSILGLGEIAASLGTAAGFVALGVAYALSDMIEDTVAGVYLLRDPDFTPGDTVTADAVTGTLAAIELRKSRIRLDNGDTVVIANRDIERRWTRSADAD